MRPICVPCRQFFRLEKGGFYFTQGKPVGSTRPEPGNAEPDKWEPYKIWAGDLWTCPGCSASIVSGVGTVPLTEHFREDFRTVRASTNADQFQVNG